MEITIQDIIARAKEYLPSLNEHRVSRAYEFAAEAHQGQTRFSGEPYIIHPLNVASILLDFHPDEDTLIAALLHDVVEDTDRTLHDIEAVFGPSVRELCWGMEKLSKVRSKLNDPQVENLRKLFLAMAKDFRVVLLKLCDRLHNISTLEHVRPEKRTRIAQETINIYAPIAGRLGIYRLKSRLEDFCFEQLNPQEYAAIQEQLVQTEKWRQQYIETAKKILNETLNRDGVSAHVDGRVKSVYSLYRKMKKKSKSSLSDIFDVFAMRIVVPDIYKYGKEYTGHLYTVLGIVHKYFTPLAHRFKDYIAVPKVNGYRSLHTTVMGLGPKIHTQPTEIQIRSESMNQTAEFGIAAHWMYDEGRSDIEHELLEEAMAQTNKPFLHQHKEWISTLGQVQQDIGNNQELLETLRVDVFQDRIFVLTPRGDVKDLPAGATPIDFAYAVHTDIGNHCIGAKVNGSMAHLDHELKSGEVVEIVTRKNARPSQHWLTFVKTTHARNRIKSWFRDMDEEKHLREGKRLLNEKLVQLGKESLDDTLSILKRYDRKHLSMGQRQELLKEMGRGALFAGTVVRKIFTLHELLAARTVEKVQKQENAIKPQKNQEEGSRLVIGGVDNMPYQFVKCCKPSTADDLIGYVTRGRGVSIHRRSCSVVRNTEDDRLIHVRKKSARSNTL